LSAAAPDLASWLVQTKLSPPRLRSDTLRRPRLLAALGDAVRESALTLISAPAGYGKTTLLASLPQAAPAFGLAWVSLDDGENDPTRFVGLVAAALQRLQPECGRSVWPLLAEAGTPDGIRRAVGALINDVMQWLPQPFILVLDDLHVVTEPTVYLGLEYLLDQLPPQMRVAVGTRHDPPLPLARLAARRRLGELRRPALTFTADEAAQLLNETLGLNLGVADLGTMQQRTEGWAVGLCLLASSLDRRATPAERTQLLEQVSRTEQFIFDFLAEEVLRRQSPAMRRFLLETAILEELTAPLCHAVTGRDDAEALLAELYRRNLFLTMTEPGVYRYHALFTEFLVRQLAAELPGHTVELHRRAARAERTPSRAVGHYLAGGLWDEAVQAILQAGAEMLDHGMLETLRQWWAVLPEAVRNASAPLLGLMGGCAIHAGDYDTARMLIERARQMLEAQGPTERLGRVLGSLVVVSAQVGDFERVRELCDSAAGVPLIPNSRSQITMNRAWLSVSAEDWSGAARYLREAVALSEETQDLGAAMTATVFAGPVLATVPGCLELMERLCAVAGRLAPPASPMRLAVDEVQAWLCLLRGQPGEALAVAAAADRFKEQQAGYKVLGSDLAALLAALHTARGAHGEAEQAAERLLVRQADGPAFLRPFWLHAAGRTFCHTGRLAEARQMLDRLSAPGETWPLPIAAFVRHHLGGLLALAEGRPADARRELTEAAGIEDRLPIAAASGSAGLLLARLDLEEGLGPAQAVRISEALAAQGMPGRVLLEGPAAPPVLWAAARAGSQGAARLLRICESLAGAGAGAGAGAAALAAAAAAGLAEPLTHREAEVLQLLAAGASNREIARRLVVGEETVKTHVARVLRKLDVSSRGQAVARGRALGITD
jgi:LuxR family maltose regulon positive regulatory protein